MKKISIVVPMYNEEEMIPLFFETTNNVIKNLDNKYKVSFTCVDDGSKDRTLDLLKKQRKIQSNIRIISFSRNFGHEAAVCAGLKQSNGDIIIVMDADLQDPPEVILQLIKKYEEGYDVVNAKRINREKDPFLKRITAEGFYSIINKLSTKNKIPSNVGNFRLMTRKVVDYINELTESNRVFRVEVPYVGFPTAEVEFVRPERIKGKTHYNYKSMFRLAGDSIVSNSIEPLRWILLLGIGFLIISIILFIIFLILKLTKVLGTLGIILSTISIWGSIILICIGIVGNYVGRTLIETQKRPLYYIKEEIEDK